MLKLLFTSGFDIVAGTPHKLRDTERTRSKSAPSDTGGVVRSRAFMSARHTLGQPPSFVHPSVPNSSQYNNYTVKENPIISLRAPLLHWVLSSAKYTVIFQQVGDTMSPGGRRAK